MSNVHQPCEICLCALPDDPFEACSCSQIQSPEFYKWGEGTNSVYNTTNFEVICVGEMRILMDTDDGVEHTIRYADDLERLGIKTDKDLQAQFDRGEERFYQDFNPWFEVWSKIDADFFSDPIYELDEAVALAIEWQQEHEERNTEL